MVFGCPTCRMPLTRPVERLRDRSLLLDDDWTPWLPAGMFVDEVMHRAVGTLGWSFNPQDVIHVEAHPESYRRIGCCGTSYRTHQEGPQAGQPVPNLLCLFGHEVGVLYSDCVGPHWVALLATCVELPDDASVPWLSVTADRLEEPRLLEWDLDEFVPDDTLTLHAEPVSGGAVIRAVSAQSPPEGLVLPVPPREADRLLRAGRMPRGDRWYPYVVENEDQSEWGLGAHEGWVYWWQWPRVPELPAVQIQVPEPVMAAAWARVFEAYARLT